MHSGCGFRLLGPDGMAAFGHPEDPPVTLVRVARVQARAGGAALPEHYLTAVAGPAARAGLPDLAARLGPDLAEADTVAQVDAWSWLARNGPATVDQIMAEGRFADGNQTGADLARLLGDWQIREATGPDGAPLLRDGKPLHEALVPALEPSQLAEVRNWAPSIIDPVERSRVFGLLDPALPENLDDLLAESAVDGPAIARSIWDWLRSNGPRPLSEISPALGLSREQQLALMDLLGDAYLVRLLARPGQRRGSAV